jgi:anaerobic selenocysteine-containing dehydrogenase
MEFEFAHMGPAGFGPKLPLDMSRRPTTDELFNFVFRHPEAPFEKVKADSVGQVMALGDQFVQPREPGETFRIDVMPDEGAAEFESCRRTGQKQSLAPDQLLLHSRRLLEAMNSAYIDSEVNVSKHPVNVLRMNPEDMASRGLVAGDEVEVASDHGRLVTTVAADASERRGAAAMHHSWSRRFDRDGRESEIAPVSVLIDKDSCREDRNFVPRMSAIPIRVTKLQPSSRETVAAAVA